MCDQKAKNKVFLSDAYQWCDHFAGREQAELTGLRLKELSFPYTLVVNSSMARAIETADIITKSLPNVPREQCDMLREGAPIPPEPPVGHWKPEQKVWNIYCKVQWVCVCFF